MTDLIKLTTPSTSDIPAILDVATAAFLYDEIYDISMPKRREYQRDFRSAMHWLVRFRMANPGYRFQVAYDYSTEPPKMIAYTCVQIEGNCKLADEWNAQAANGKWSFTAWVERNLLEMEVWYDEHVYRNPAIAWDVIAWIRASLGDSFKEFPALLHLKTLVVSPEWQGKGIGRKMLEWTKDIARLERLPVGLNSSLAGRKLYDKTGFKVISWDDMKGLKVPNMVWEPEGFENQWLEPTDDSDTPFRVKPGLKSKGDNIVKHEGHH